MAPISVCIIAKNEEKNIERCLSSLTPYGFEIVLIDTGSTDKTKELASKYTDCIYDYEWADDFSAARNYSLQKATYNWILMLDCDEWIESLDIEELDYFRKHLSHAAGSVTRKNITGTPDKPSTSIDRTERFFSKKYYQYTGIIHEQLTPKFEKTFETFLLNTTIGHSGYCMTDEERQLKSKRNIDLLLKQLTTTPNNPYTYYQLGKGYQMIEDYDTACRYYDKGLSFDIDSELAYVQSMVIEYGHCLLSTGQYEKALSFKNIYDTFCSSADFIYLMGEIYLENKLYENALDEFLKAVTFEFSNREGVTSFLSYYQIAKILYMAEEYPTAIQYLKLCGEYPPALQMLQSLNIPSQFNIYKKEIGKSDLLLVVSFAMIITLTLLAQ